MIQQTGNSIRYPGGKNVSGTWQQIVSLLPVHSVYAEPFVGSGALLRHKAPALRSIVMDVTPDVTAWHRRLAMPGVEVLDGCGIEWLESIVGEVTDQWCIYCDPPYMLETRTKQKIYGHELTDADHRRLLSAVMGLECAVLVSGYLSDLYASALASWYRRDMRVMTRGGPRIESVWCNFHPRRQTPHDTRWPGRDYRERERIQRKAKRWRRMYGDCPPYERRALLDELLAMEQELRGGE